MLELLILALEVVRFLFAVFETIQFVFKHKKDKTLSARNKKRLTSRNRKF
jgi:hypothetical protein